MSSAEPVRVAIVGGGCAAMATAFELTRPEHRGRYRVTVYQQGWRLGGKGASGRGPGARIEEHGLHLWMGFYENAFRLLRECYGELDRDPATCPIATWRDALTPVPLVAVADRTADGAWRPWIARLPADDGLPGDPLPAGVRWRVQDYFRHTIELLRALFESLDPISAGRAGGARHPAAQGAAGDASGGSARQRLSRLLRYGELATLAAMIEATTILELLVGSAGKNGDALLLRALSALGTSAREQLDDLASRDPEVGALWTIADLTLATLLGVVRFGLLTDPRGFDAVDEYDCREWLLLNGASRRSVDSGYMRGLYDLVFAYEDGDPARPRISAGQALRSMARSFFTYRGAFFWRMQAGMGDVVFAPYFEVLERRGVRFEFFHRLTGVQLAEATSGAPADRPHVRGLEFDVQADVVGGRPYRPLVTIGGLPCWPAEPDWAQLEDGELLRREGREFEAHWDRGRVRSRTLEVSRDFDLVVLAVGLGAIPHVCREIVDRDPRWRAMLAHVKTVPTQAFQIWLREGIETLGWDAPPVTLSGFVEPFDTWADMRHLIPREQFQVEVRGLAYFCSVLPEDQVPAGGATAADAQRARERVRENAVRFLRRDLPHLWPRVVQRDGEFRWDLLVDPREAPGATPPAGGAERFASQFWTANVCPSERYVLSLPGSSGYRISPLDETYDNLTVAGDWTDCGFNAGCVEAAVMSGRLAAHAISRSPALADIVGFDHP